VFCIGAGGFALNKALSTRADFDQAHASISLRQERCFHLAQKFRL
jgi:hypothetical protein